MKVNVTVKQTYEWKYEIEADTMAEADRKARKYFRESNDGVTGVCDALHAGLPLFALKKID